MKSKSFFTARNVAFLSVLLALVVVLQVFGGYIKIGATSLSFVLVPIVLGSVMIGPLAGLFLGFVFGLIVFLYGATGADPFTFILFSEHPFLTALICFGKGMAAGVVPGLLYGVLKKKNRYLGVVVASLSAPIVNTALFILGALCMSGTLQTNFVEEGSTVIYFLIVGCAGINFLVEFGINLVASPAVYRVTELVKKYRLGRNAEREEKEQETPRAEVRELPKEETHDLSD